MNRFLIAFLTLLSCTLFGQAIRIDPHNTGWLPVRSYHGAQARNLINVIFHLENTQGLHMDRWSLFARVVGPITNGEQTFSLEDVGKLKFQLTDVKSNQPNAQGAIASLGNIGGNLALIPFSNASTPFVVNSPFNLQIKNYLQLSLSYSVSIDGGAYLRKYSSWANYKVFLEFELRNRKGDIMTYSEPTQLMSFDMQIHPDDAPPATNAYTIGLSPSAENVHFEFRTPSDYANGMTNEQLQALSVTAETPYVVQVNTLSNDLTSPSGSLPMNSVQLTMRDSNTGVSNPAVTLSTTSQALFRSSAHTELKTYDLSYFIKPPTDNSGFFNKPYELYSGSIIFSITPQ